jgi:hypothetical protein
MMSSSNCDCFWNAVSIFGCFGACSYLVASVSWINNWCGLFYAAGVQALANCLCDGNCGSAPMAPLECGDNYQPDCE